MTTLQVEQLRFTFETAVDPFQYERAGIVVHGWPAGWKVIDVVADDPAGAPRTVWLIEVKDFRVITNPPKPANLTLLAQTVDAKVRATLGALPIVAAASNDAGARAHASAAGSVAARMRVVLHLEPHAPSGPQSALFPRGLSALILQKLKQLTRGIDATPLVLDIARTSAAGVPWVTV